MGDKIKSRNSEVQILRGLAVIAVVFFHAKNAFFPNGYLGVDLFFALSGFVITPQIIRVLAFERKMQGLHDFYLRRFLRLAPALGSTIFFALILLYVFGRLDELWNIAAQSLFSLLGAGNLGAFKYSPNYFFSNPNPLLHIWSLAVEVQIYIFIPLVLVLVQRLSRKGQFVNNRSKTLVFLFTASLITSLSPIFFDSQFLENTVYYNFFSRIWEFLFGSFLAINSGRFRLMIKRPKIVYWLSLMAIIFTLFFPIKIESHLLLFILLPSAVFLLGSEFEMPNKLIADSLKHIGDRSYSIYLVHMPLLYLAKYAPGVGAGNVQNLLVLVAIFLSYGLGAAQFALIENRFRVGSPRFRNTGDRPTVYVALLFVFIPLVANISIIASIKTDFKPFISKDYSFETRDKRLLFNRECTDKDVNLEICTSSISDSAPTVFLVGDSQAYAAAEGVRKAANSLGLNFSAASASGCPFLENDSTGEKTFECEIFKEKAWDYILSEKPRLVVIANRTNGYLEPSLNWRTLISANGVPAQSDVEATEIYGTALASLSEQLQKIGSKLIVYQNVLEPKSIGIPDSIFKYLLFRSEFLSGYSSYYLNLNARNVEVSIMDAGDLYLFDPNLVICGGDCREKIFVKEFFEDRTHLSRTGSLKMFSAFSDKLRQLVAE